MKEAVDLSRRIPQGFLVQVLQHLGKGGGIGIGLLERQPYPPGGDADSRSDLEQLQAKRGTLARASSVPAVPSRRRACMSTQSVDADKAGYRKWQYV